MKGLGTIAGADLMVEVQAFLKRSGMAPTMFCKAALGDPGAWGKWRGGASVTDRTVARVRQFIAEHGRPPEAAKLSAPQKKLLRLIAAVPAAEKLPLSRLARELNASHSILTADITALIEGGHLNKETLRPPTDRSGGCANRAKPGAAPQDGAALDAPSATGGVARDGGNAVARETEASPPVDHPSGEQLVDELRNAATGLNIPLSDFLAPLRGSMAASGYLRQLGIAKRPKPETVERIRAHIAGRNVDPTMPPAHMNRQQPDSVNHRLRERSLSVVEERRGQEQRMLEAADMGRALRAPGETLADAVRRESIEDGERRHSARCTGTVANPVPLRKVIAHHPKARKFEPLPPDIFAQLKNLAEEFGETPMALLPRVVEQGIEAIRKAA